MSAAAVRIRPGDLAGTKEAMAILGVDKTTVSRWKRQGYLPEPFQVLAAGPVWLVPVLERFKAEHEASADAAGRRPGAGRAAA